MVGAGVQCIVSLHTAVGRNAAGPGLVGLQGKGFALVALDIAEKKIGREREGESMSDTVGGACMCILIHNYKE